MQKSRPRLVGRGGETYVSCRDDIYVSRSKLYGQDNDSKKPSGDNMSRTLSYVFFALCAGTLFASAAQAEDYDKRFYLAPAVSYNFFGENGFDNELGAQLSIGRAFSKSLNLELVANTTEPNITGGKATLN